MRPFLYSICSMLALISVARVTADPVALWEFEAEDVSGAVAEGAVQRDVLGPRPPEYPDFDKSNTAIQLDGNGARLSVADPGPTSIYDFTNGDTITLEAWIQTDGADGEEIRNLVSKGRADDEQGGPNWAMALRPINGQLCLSFVFATQNAVETKESQHRWTSETGFLPGADWHHVALTYRFGQPDTILGWIDGKPLKGSWDLGGQTQIIPVFGDEPVWIGGALGGDSKVSFEGKLDAIAIHRQGVESKEMAARFRWTENEDAVPLAPAIMPELGPLPSGQVIATLHEGMPTHDRWLNVDETIPDETMRWIGTEFLLPRLPLRYDEWGIRESWKAPVLTLLAADVELPAGKHRIVLRARGLSRLWIDGKLVAETGPHGRDGGGHDPVVPIPEPPLPGLRSVGYGVKEVFGEIDVDSNRALRVVLESIVGGKALRAEPGEMTVAVETADGRSYDILQAANANRGPIPLTDKAVEQRVSQIEAKMNAFDDNNRRTAAASQRDYWRERHHVAREWAEQQEVAQTPSGESHPIDAFLVRKIDQAVAAAAKTPSEVAQQFHGEVLPILRDECFRCHGEKSKGGLLLDSLQGALTGGESELPAVVPGKASESELILRLTEEFEEDRMPPNGDPLHPEKIATLEAWINSGAAWPAPPLDSDAVALAPVVDDAAFLRRAFFDTVGLPPTEADIRSFLADRSENKRTQVIDRLLADERWADHWISYWQDVLAENPSMLKPSLNNTGPFRWYLHEALRDGKSLDRMVTELIMLRGSIREGGTAGFGLAVSNDAPFAAKGHIIATAFLGIEMQCARCHDSPYHSTSQRDLYSLAALFERKPVTVPESSRVPDAFFEELERESLIKVTLNPNELIEPAWPFEEQTGLTDSEQIRQLMRDPQDSRERLATLLTAPQNTRFSEVIVNRVWKRLMGAGFVEPVHDWEGQKSSHPELLSWMAREFVKEGYDLRKLSRLIMTSKAYQRTAVGRNLQAAPEQRFFAAPEPRRLTAEQVVDSLFAASGRDMDVEELSFDPAGHRAASAFVSFGKPRRSWMMASLSNERDRPSLTLPRAQVVSDVLESFDWTGSRQNPRSVRSTDPNVLQPGVLANGALSQRIASLSEGSELVELALKAESPESLIESVFLRFYSRLPSHSEKTRMSQAIASGFDTRLLPKSEIVPIDPHPPLPYVSWANHLSPEANSVQMEKENRARAAPFPDPRFRPEWRESFEDVVWSLINTREFVWLN